MVAYLLTILWASKWEGLAYCSDIGVLCQLIQYYEPPTSAIQLFTYPSGLPKNHNLVVNKEELRTLR